MDISFEYTKFMEVGSAQSVKQIDFQLLFKAAVELVEYVATCNPTELKAFLRNKSEDELYYMPYWLKLIIIKLITLNDPSDSEMIEWAMTHLSWFVEVDSEIITDLKKMLLKNV